MSLRDLRRRLDKVAGEQQPPVALVIALDVSRAEALERHRQERHAGGSCDCRVIVVCQREE